MKKNEYVSPEMEVVEIMEQGSLLAGMSGGEAGGDRGTGDPGDEGF